MAHYLLVYDRAAGRLIRTKRFHGRSEALQARFKAEGEFRGKPEIEIVVLSAKNKRDLLRTHGRYFLGLEQLVDRLG